MHELRPAGLVAADLAESIGNLAGELLGQPSSGSLPEFQIQMEEESMPAFWIRGTLLGTVAWTVCASEPS